MHLPIHLADYVKMRGFLDLNLCLKYKNDLQFIKTDLGTLH